MLEGRLLNALEAVVFSLIMVFVFFVFALLIKLIFRKSVHTTNYYTAAIVIGALIPFVLIPVVTQQEPYASNNLNPTEQVNDSKTGMYAPFIAPGEDKLESFIGQLDSATSQLPPNERKEVTEAVTFLGFALVAHLVETDPENFDNLSESDLAAKNYLKLYNFAREQGDDMSLSKYVELASEFKKVKPEFWEQYKALIEQP